MAAYRGRDQAVATGNGGIHARCRRRVLVCWQGHHVRESFPFSYGYLTADATAKSHTLWTLSCWFILVSSAARHPTVCCMLVNTASDIRHMDSCSSLQGTNGEMRGPADAQAQEVPQNSLEEKLRRRMTVDHQVGLWPSCSSGGLFATRFGHSFVARSQAKQTQGCCDTHGRCHSCCTFAPARCASTTACLSCIDIDSLWCRTCRLWREQTRSGWECCWVRYSGRRAAMSAMRPH